MARIRAVKPDLFLDEDLAEVSPMARLLLIGLWTLADKEGRLEDRPKRIKGALLPYSPEVDVEALLGELAGHRRRFIVRYEAEGQACIAITDFLKDQRPHPKETSFGLPPPPEPGPSTASRETSRQGVDASRRVPVVGGCGSGDGSGNGSTASQAPAVAAPPGVIDDTGQQADEHAPPEAEERPPLVLAVQPGGRKPRNPSKAERLYAGLQASRLERCREAGVLAVDEHWAPSRQNHALGELAKLQAGTPEAKLLNDAWDAYLADNGQAAKDVPWSLGYFLASRSTWEGRALKAAGGGRSSAAEVGRGASAATCDGCGRPGEGGAAGGPESQVFLGYACRCMGAFMSSGLEYTEAKAWARKRRAEVAA